jgi:hypothetical protein
MGIPKIKPKLSITFPQFDNFKHRLLGAMQFQNFFAEPLLEESRKHQVPQTWVIKPNMRANGGLSWTNQERLAGNVFAPSEVHFLYILSPIVSPLASSLSTIYASNRTVYSQYFIGPHSLPHLLLGIQLVGGRQFLQWRLAAGGRLCLTIFIIMGAHFSLPAKPAER